MSETKELAKSAKVVQDALNNKGFTIDVIALPASARTALDAANALNCDTAQIVKSLMFKAKASECPILVLASGTNRVNEKQIGKLVGEKVVKADAQFTREVTGFAIGGIPPLAHKHIIDHIFIDEDLLQYDSLWAAAGTPETVFNFKASDITTLTNGKIVSIK